MINMIMHGCCGAMGRVITNLIKDDEEIAIVAGIDPNGGTDNPYPVFHSLQECSAAADVLIDFTTAKAVSDLLDYCSRRNLASVICTTGLSPEQTSRIEEISKKTAILRSANMSLGINLLFKLVKEAAAVLAAADFDIEILEKHHNRKVDAPSGTALSLAAAINEAMDNAYHYQFDRSQRRKQREKDEIGIQSVRGGTIVGEHDVIFAGEDEVITFTHSAYSKAIFAKGAISAAKFLAGKGPGLYSMADVIEKR